MLETDLLTLDAKIAAVPEVSQLSEHAYLGWEKHGRVLFGASAKDWPG